MLTHGDVMEIVPVGLTFVPGPLPECIRGRMHVSIFSGREYFLGVCLEYVFSGLKNNNFPRIGGNFSRDTRFM